MYNILLVEDDKNIREMLVEYFSKRDKEKFNITLAENGLKGLDKAYENSYDLLLLDVMLPRNGRFYALQRNPQIQRCADYVHHGKNKRGRYAQRLRSRL